MFSPHSYRNANTHLFMRETIVLRAGPALEQIFIRSAVLQSFGNSLTPILTAHLQTP